MSSVNKTVYSDGRTIHIPLPDGYNTYQIAVDRVTTVKKIMWWLDWLKQKTWITESQIEEFKYLSIKYLK